MIDTDKYEGHSKGPWELGRYFSRWKIYWFDKEMSDNWDSIRDFGEEYRHEDFCFDVGVVASTESNARLMADAPLLLAEVKRLREEINQLPIDLLESLDMILEAHHPEVRESVMAMFGDAIGNNVVGYEE